MSTTTLAAPRVDVDAHVEYQHERIATYQADLARVGGNRQLVSPAAMKALGEVLADIDGLLRKTANDQIRRRFPYGPPEDLFEECLAEARLACIEAVADYQPGTRPFAYWVTSPNSGGRAFVAIRDVITAETRTGNLTRGQENVLRYLHVVADDLRASGHEPSMAQIADGVERRCTQWALNRIAEQREREGRPAPQFVPDSTVAELEEDLGNEVVSRLTKEGTWAALRELPELMARADRICGFDPALVDVGLATLAGAGQPPELSGEANELARVAVCGMTPAQREVVWAHLFGEESSAPRRANAGVQDLLDQARAHLAAPHAHFAALSPTIDLQFDRTPARPEHDPTALADVVRRVHLGS